MTKDIDLNDPDTKWVLSQERPDTYNWHNPIDSVEEDLKEEKNNGPRRQN